MSCHMGEKGLTLIEVIIAATLMTLVVCGALLLYEREMRSWVWTEQYSDVVDNLRIAVDKVAYDVRGATSIAVYDGGQTLGLINSESSVRYTYDAVGGELARNGAPVTTGVITAVDFSQPNPWLVKIELWGKGRETGEVSVRTAVYARALSP